MENSTEVPQKKIQNRVTLSTSNPTFGYLPQTFIHKDIYTPIFIAALFVVAKTWSQPKYPSIEDWIKKMWYIYTMGYYSAIRKDEILPFVSTWMDLENLMLSETS